MHFTDNYVLFCPKVITLSSTDNTQSCVCLIRTKGITRISCNRSKKEILCSLRKSTTDSICLREAGLMFTTLNRVYAEKVTVKNQFQPLGICIPLIIAHIDWAPGIWIYFNRSSVTSDSNEVHYLGGGIRSEGCVCVEGPGDTGRQTHTHTHHITKNTSHLPHCVPAETETTQLAVPSLCLCCVFTTQRQMVSWHRSTLMSLGGSAGSTFISAVLFQFTTTSRCTHMHTKKRQRGTKNSLTP